MFCRGAYRVDKPDKLGKQTNKQSSAGPASLFATFAGMRDSLRLGWAAGQLDVGRDIVYQLCDGTGARISERASCDTRNKNAPAVALATRMRRLQHQRLSQRTEPANEQTNQPAMARRIRRRASELAGHATSGSMGARASRGTSGSIRERASRGTSERASEGPVMAPAGAQDSEQSRGTDGGYTRTSQSWRQCEHKIADGPRIAPAHENEPAGDSDRSGATAAGSPSSAPTGGWLAGAPTRHQRRPDRREHQIASQP